MTKQQFDEMMKEHGIVFHDTVAWRVVQMVLDWQEKNRDTPPYEPYDYSAILRNSFGVPDKEWDKNNQPQDPSTAKEEHPFEFISHHLLGENPLTDDGYFETKEKAMNGFVNQLIHVMRFAEHKFIWIRKAPELLRSGSDGRYQMYGRFSIVDLKDKNK